MSLALGPRPRGAEGTGDISDEGQQYLQGLLARYGIQPSTLTSSAHTTEATDPMTSALPDSSGFAGARPHAFLQDAQAQQLHDPVALIRATLLDEVLQTSAAPPTAPAPAADNDAAAAAPFIAAILAAVQNQANAAPPPSTTAQRSAPQTAVSSGAEGDAPDIPPGLAAAREKNRRAQAKFRAKQKKVIEDQRREILDKNKLIEELVHQVQGMEQQLQEQEHELQQLRGENQLLRTRMDGNLLGLQQGQLRHNPMQAAAAAVAGYMAAAELAQRHPRGH